MSELQHSVEQFLYSQADLCDRKDWDAYIDTFTPDSEFWIPQWDSEHEYIDNPKTGMSLIYYANRSGIEDRVFRLRTGKSAASNPLPRTLHQISNVKVRELSDGKIEAQFGWQTNYTRLGSTEMLYGTATLDLVKQADEWKVQRKHAVIFNDIINSVMDFYHV